jgi:Ni,Fe-hydrogenase III component G
MSDKKQTAVNFLRDEAIKLVVQAMQGTLNENTLEYQISQIVTKALEMEREQMEKAVSNGISKADMIDNRGYFNFDKWYNETYGGSK